MKIELPLDGTARAHLKTISKALFGGGYDFEAMLMIAGSERFFGTELTASGCAGSYVPTLLRKLETAGLIQRLDREPGQTRHYYAPLPSPFWEMVVAWAEDELTSVRAGDNGVRRLPARPSSGTALP